MAMRDPMLFAQARAENLPLPFRTEQRPEPKPGEGKERCACGRRFRGKNHRDGDHHNGRVKRCGRH